MEGAAAAETAESNTAKKICDEKCKKEKNRIGTAGEEVCDGDKKTNKKDCRKKCSGGPKKSCPDTVVEEEKDCSKQGDKKKSKKKECGEKERRCKQDCSSKEKSCDAEGSDKKGCQEKKKKKKKSAAAEKEDCCNKAKKDCASQCKEEKACCSNGVCKPGDERAGTIMNQEGNSCGGKYNTCDNAGMYNKKNLLALIVTQR